MRLVQVRLRPSVPFWFIGDIVRLNQNNKISDFFDVDSLDEGIKKIINLSIFRQEIMAFDYSGSRIGSLDEAKLVSGNHAISIEDVNDEEEEKLIPEIVSVTIESSEPEIEEEEKIPAQPSEEHIENAKILLEQNGNTVKRMIKNMKTTDDNIMILRACLREETVGKNRKGVITLVERTLMECYNE